MTIDQWLSNASEQFSRAGIPTARLDAEVLLCHILGVDRSYLIAHGEDSLARTALTHPGGVHPGGVTAYGERLVLRRLKREPIAYLVGEKEFYGRNFSVNKHVLVPRPETEALIDLAKKYHFTGSIIDVGCGSGAIGLSLALELGGSSVTLSDISLEALVVARSNAKRLKAKVDFVESDLLGSWMKDDHRFDAVVANLPYVDRSWERSAETDHEPYLALFAQEGGLALIKELVDQAPAVMSPQGYLLLESDPEQHPAIKDYASPTFETIETSGYALLLRKL